MSLVQYGSDFLQKHGHSAKSKAQSPKKRLIVVFEFLHASEPVRRDVDVPKVGVSLIVVF